MKTIGLLGGMSCESTALYYEVLNREVRVRLGGLHSAQVLMYSLDFAPVEALQRDGHWEAAAEIIARGVDALADGHADLALICSITGQRDWRYLQERARIPLVCARTVLIDAIRRSGVKAVGLLGTRYTMEQTYFREALESAGLRVQIPSPAARERIQTIIYDELCRGEQRDASRTFLLEILGEWKTQGLDGAVLGCTELPLLISENGAPLPIFDIVRLHARAALDLALAQE